MLINFFKFLFLNYILFIVVFEFIYLINKFDIFPYLHFLDSNKFFHSFYIKNKNKTRKKIMKKIKKNII